jgi:hypothetical protein
MLRGRLGLVVIPSFHAIVVLVVLLVLLVLRVVVAVMSALPSCYTSEGTLAIVIGVALTIATFLSYLPQVPLVIAMT